MNKLTIFVILLIASAVFACDSDFDPVNTIVGTCTTQHNAGFKAPSSVNTALTPADIPADELAMHEARMDYIIALARAANKKFVASIYAENGTLMCTGINTGIPNSISHGEIVAINNCTALYGTKYFNGMTLYTTGEPCTMCASALMWAQFKTVVWGTYNHDLHCKICMSNIPLESTSIFDTYAGLGISKIRVIGGVRRTEADAWFGSYCSKPTSIYYISPQCNCVNINKTQTLNFTQTVSSSWLDSGSTQYTQFAGVIKNIGDTTVSNPLFVTYPPYVAPQNIWGLTKTSVEDQWALAWNPTLAPGQTFNFGYIIQGSNKLNFYQE